MGSPVVYDGEDVTRGKPRRLRQGGCHGDAHTELCRGFLTESVTRAGHDELVSTDGIGKMEFVSFLEEAE
ncbi:hypothetical protein D3D02_16780 [Halobellus sp. Atlit-38R]|nr:hypothetical protein D3D02_16780 [Halobellus sp. Atlit-38R]